MMTILVLIAGLIIGVVGFLAYMIWSISKEL
jgi:hypothetical protein